MPELDSAVLKKSVTQGDYNQAGAIYLMVPRAYNWLDRGLPASLENVGLRAKDAYLVSTVDYEAMWAAAVFIATTKMSSLSWEVTGDIGLRARRAHELLLAADLGGGWVSFLSKHLQDYLCTNNGSFVEVVRASTSLSSQIIGLVPLDSLRCTRTGDPERPVVYQDLKGAQHELRAHEVILMSDMPSPRASLFGTGKCAADRAYSAIYKLFSIETYFSEKITGRRPLALNFINGMNDFQLRQVLQTAQSQADAQGAIAYMGAIIATIPGETPPSVATVPLADFPDRFDRKEETNLALLTYADNIGLDPQDLQPLTGQALGTGAQSMVLEEKSRGKGLAAWRQQFTHNLNTWVLPDLTTFAFIEHDYRDQKLKADVNSLIEATVNRSVERGILSPAQGLQVLVDAGIYPETFLPEDTTSEETLEDDEKPGEEAPAADAQPPLPQPLPVTTEKAAGPDIGALMEGEAPRARELAKKLLKARKKDAT